MSLRHLLLLLSLFQGRPTRSLAQELAQAPEVAKLDKNFIQRPLELSFFFRRLRQIEARKAADPPERVTILEIGDSHLQGDQFSHPLRLALEKRFGLAGRGLVFPYSVAHSSNAWDLISESNVPWAHRRSAVAAPQGLEDLDSGVAGFSIMTHDPGYVLRIGVNSDEMAFDQVSIFSRRDPAAYGMKLSLHEDPQILEHQNMVPQDELEEVLPGDTLSGIARRHGVSLKDLREWNRLKNDEIFAGDTLIVKKEMEKGPAAPIAGFRDIAYCQGGASQNLSFTARLDGLHEDIFLRGLKDKAEEEEAVIYGLDLERAGASGVIYDTAGVNGAQLKSFARSPRFMQQARCLDPDLVMIALGTNESMSEELDLRDIEENLLTLRDGFTRGNSKYVAFLIVTPPDVLDWQGHLNSRVAEVAMQLRLFSERHGFALWDWQNIMGGPGSVLSWREAHLVGSDGVHMNAAGYELQSHLFYEALMEAYEHQ